MNFKSTFRLFIPGRIVPCIMPLTELKLVPDSRIGPGNPRGPGGPSGPAGPSGPGGPAPAKLYNLNAVLRTLTRSVRSSTSNFSLSTILQLAIQSSCLSTESKIEK